MRDCRIPESPREARRQSTELKAQVLDLFEKVNLDNGRDAGLQTTSSSSV